MEKEEGDNDISLFIKQTSKMIRRMFEAKLKGFAQ